MNINDVLDNRPWVVSVLLRRYVEGKSIDTTVGGSQVMVYEEETAGKLAEGTRESLQALRFVDRTGRSYGFEQLADDQDFKKAMIGVGPPSLVSQLKSLQASINHIKETTGLSYVEVVAGPTFEVSSLKTVPGPSLADFVFLDPDDKEVAWFRYLVSEQQSYSGLGRLRGNDEVQSFVRDIDSLMPGGLPYNTAVARKIWTVSLRKAVMFGGSGFSRNSVDGVLSGRLSLVKDAGHDRHRLVASTIILKGIGRDVDSNWEPVLMATSRRVDHGDMRGDTRSDFGIPNTSFWAFPAGSQKFDAVI